MQLSNFAYLHLPVELQPTSKIFHDTAHEVCSALPPSYHRNQVLDKLWEAKNLAVVAKMEVTHAINTLKAE